jgi:hypothetical protein
LNKELVFGSHRFLIFVGVCAFFVWTQYEFFLSMGFSFDLIKNFGYYSSQMQLPWWIATFYASELGGSVGGILRWAMSILALYCGFVYWRGGTEVWTKIRGKVCACLLLEAGYFLFLTPTIWLGFIFPVIGGAVWYFETTPVWEVFFAAGLTSLFMVLLVAPALLKLRSIILRGSSRADIFRWTWVVAVVYLFVVFWLNYSLQWAGMLSTWGFGMLLDPLNLMGFVVSVVGFFAVAAFGLLTVFPVIKKEPVELSLNRLGLVSAGFGGLIVFGVLVYFVAGGFAAYPFAWYELIVPHNPYLWCVVFLFIGVSMLFLVKRRN